MKTPRATYRLQFNEHFRLTDALALVPYLHALGISHIYASPLFKASPHSSHGYDVCDFNQLNPEIGTEADLEKLADALHEKQMGLILDIVPNHMGITSPENLRWWDVLKNGRASKFANHFDIDWDPAEKDLRGKILLPVLGDEYERILTKKELRIEEQNGDFNLRYYENKFPLAPKSIPENFPLEKTNADPAALDQLIQRQNYRLEFHEHGDAKLNYRRFFSVSSLAGVRVEDERVFEDTHSLVRKLLESELIDGLRVDHPDGLLDPEGYLQRLRAIAPDAWIVVEKILEREESLPTAWPVAGTTGYDFLNQVNGLFVDAGNAQPFTDFYARFTGEPVECTAIIRDKKRRVLKTLFATELSRLTDLLFAAAVRRVTCKNVPRSVFQEALVEIIVHFPVYRSYISETHSAPSTADVAAIKSATHLACEMRKDISPSIFAFIHELLLKPQRAAAARHFIARFQQLTGPVMAKGVEDTAFYCFNRFISLNEVGGSPEHFGTGLDALHEYFATQQHTWPHSQLTTSTHDTKRAEDVRARLNLLSEIPERWTQTVRRWSTMNECHRQHRYPDRNAEYLLYQTLVGAWPLTSERVQAYMEKAIHESKQYTNWTQRNPIYEGAVQNFISEILHDPEFTADLEHFANELAQAGHINSLAQTLIKLTAPGVPDIYQGCELWDFSLVDPDNRRPVDFKLRQQLLEEIHSLPVEKIWQRHAEGLPKMWVIQKTLQLRERQTGFSKLNYQRLLAAGAKSDHVFAFARGIQTITVVPRLVLKLNHDWKDTELELPVGNWQNEFTGENFSGTVQLEKLLEKFPVALLARKEMA